MKKVILSIAIALGFLAHSSVQADVIGGIDFDSSSSFSFAFAFAETGEPTFTNSVIGNGNASENAFTATADLTPADGSSFAGFGGGFGIFGAPLLGAPAGIGDFDISFDARFDGIVDTSNPIATTLELTFRYPDAVADGDDGVDGDGNPQDFPDDIFRVDVPFEIAAVNGTFQTISVNLGGGTVNVGAGGTPENDRLTFDEFINGDPDIPGRDFSLVDEFLVNFVVADGVQFGFDADNSLSIDNVVLEQVAVPEPSSLILLSAVGLLGYLRRSRS